jgi:chromosome partitioning protein
MGQAGEGARAQGKAVRSASPPASTTERAAIAEASPAGERSGRGAVPGPAHDGETSTVDQSRERPVRDTASRQDPAESRVDPIWGADPPDSVRWHMGMTSNAEAATDKQQDPQSQPNQNGTTEPERSTASPAGKAIEQAGPPAEQRAADGVTTPPTSRTPEDDVFDVGWFSAGSQPGGPDAGDYSGTLSEQLSAERPGDEPAHGSVTDTQPPPGAPDGHALNTPGMEGGDSVGPEGSTSPRESSGAGERSGGGEPAAAEGSSGPGGSVGGTSAGGEEPREVAESSGAAATAGGVSGPEDSRDSTEAPESVGPEASTGQENAPIGAGSALGRQELPSPELIEAGMVYLDPDPEIGSPPSAAGWTEWSPADLVPQEGSGSPTDAAVPEVGGVRHPVGDVSDSVGLTREAEQLEEGSEAEDVEQVGEAAGAAGSAGIGGVQSVGPVQSGGTDEGAGITDAGDETMGVARVEETAGAGVPGDVGAAGPTHTAGVSGSEEAGSSGHSAHEGEASLDSTLDLTPWVEPALPMAWPPGMAPSARGESLRSQEDPADRQFPPQPDPSWPRLFGRSREGDGSGEAGDVSYAGQATADPPAEIDREQNSEEVAEDPHSQREGTGFEPSGEDDLRSSAEEPVAEEPMGEEPVGEQSVGPAEPQDLDATSEAGLASGEPAGTSAAPSVEPRQGDPKSSVVAPVGGSGKEAASSAASGESNTPATSPPPTVDGTTSESETDSRPSEQLEAGPLGAEGADLPIGPAAASIPEGGEGGGRRANISTVVGPAEAGEVDLHEAPAGTRGDDVSRETSVGGEEMDPALEDEESEDEAAIAVRDAVSRAAAEAGVDVSRETNSMAEDGTFAEPSADETIDIESAARNARVTFRIHRETLNGIRRVMAVANQKGGVGKSTTAVNLGAYLALAGARVLVIDLDPQGNASTGLGLDHRDIEPSIYDVLTGEAATAAAIRATGVPNLHVLPSTIDLAGAEVELVSAMSRETRLRRALESIDHQYDTILIDCPPSLGLLTVNALAAANELLIPIQCEYYALEGLGQLLRNVELVRANLNPELRIGGIVLTMYDGRTRLALQVVEEVRKHFTDVVYQTVVPRSVRLSEAPGYGLPIALYDPLSRGGIAYRDLTYELAERSGLLAPTGEGAS